MKASEERRYPPLLGWSLATMGSLTIWALLGMAVLD